MGTSDGSKTRQSPITQMTLQERDLPIDLDAVGHSTRQKRTGKTTRYLEQQARVMINRVVRPQVVQPAWWLSINRMEWIKLLLMVIVVLARNPTSGTPRRVNQSMLIWQHKKSMKFRKRSPLCTLGNYFSLWNFIVDLGTLRKKLEPELS
jgi:hypothetical protein